MIVTTTPTIEGHTIKGSFLGGGRSSRSVGKTLRGQGNSMIMISISGTAVVID